MKYFTMDWWSGNQDDETTDPIIEYQKHLAKIRVHLPKDITILEENVSLHDARLRELVCSIDLRTVTMKLDGRGGQRGLQHLHLHYIDVASFSSSADPNSGLRGPHGYGDLGYDEVDITPDGRIEHRILFSSGIEFRIVFNKFEFAWEDAT